MAISLSWGVLFATLITLFLVPSLYMILHDILGYGDNLVEAEEEPEMGEVVYQD